jgi:hypothetical protein
VLKLSGSAWQFATANSPAVAPSADSAINVATDALATKYR